MKNKILSLILAVMMILSIMPFTMLSASAETECAIYIWDSQDSADSENVEGILWTDTVTGQFTLPEPGDIELPLENLDGGFLGYVSIDGSKLYKAGEVYDAGDAEFIHLLPSYGTLPTVYLSSDGKIDIDVTGTVYSSLADADADIAENGGTGIIIVEGDVNLPNTYSFQSSDLTIKALNDTASNATVLFTPNNNDSVWTTTSVATTNITFANIKVRRADDNNGERYVRLENVNLTFDATCTYESGKNGSSNIDLYFVAPTKSTIGYTLTINSSQFKALLLAPLGGYYATHSTSGNYTYNLNAGTFSQVFTGMRDTANKDPYSSVSGNVIYNINGATVTFIDFGGNYGIQQTGTATVNYKSGNLGTVVFGPYSGAPTTANGRHKVANAILTLDGKTLNETQSPMPKITQSAYATGGNTVGNLAYVVNNADEITEPELPAEIKADAAYTIKVNEGSASVVEILAEGAGAKAKLTSDDPEKTDVYVNDVKVTLDNGAYTFAQGVNNVTFMKAGVNLVSLAYEDDFSGNVAIEGTYSTGDVYTIPLLTKAGYTFAGFKYDGTTYNAGEEFTIPSGVTEVVFDAQWIVNANNVYYVASTGSDTALGNTSEVPFKTIARAMQYIGTANATIVVMDEVNEWPFNSLGNAYTDTSFTVTLDANQKLIVTGKDIDGTIYPNAAINRGAGRASIVSGHLELSHIKDKANAHNIYITLKDDADLTLGTGYTFECKNNSYKGPQVNFTTGTGNHVLNIDGPTNRVYLNDYGSTTHTGDITVNFGPNAEFVQEQAFVFGGDFATWSNTAKINGNAFINFDGTKPSSVKKVMFGGFVNINNKEGKNDTAAVTGTAQILLKNTKNITTQAWNPDFFTAGNKFIITANNVPEGCDVVSSAAGKISLTIPAGFKAAVKQGDSAPVIYLTNTEVTLTNENVTVEFIPLLNIYGAQIRTATATKKQGLRFIAEYDADLKARYADAKEYGMLVIPTKALADAELTADGTYELTQAKVTAVYDYLIKDEYTWYTACLTDVDAQNYTTEFTARTYIEVEEGVYLYGEAYSTSIYAVAQQAIVEHEAGTQTLTSDELAAIQAIIDAVENN